MQLNDQAEFSEMLQEMAAMYRGTLYNDFFAQSYWKVLKPYSMIAVRRACLDLLGNEMRKQLMPTAAEIKSVARRYEPPAKPSRAEVDEERWRRRYDAWQAGGFSDEALAQTWTMTDEELRVGAESDETYLRCQTPGCRTLIPWPAEDGASRCRVHGTEAHGPPATRAEKRAILRTLTPKGAAFLRSILPDLMAEIPVSPAEAACTEAPLNGIPAKLAAYLETVDAATAQQVLSNYLSAREDADGHR